MNRCRKLSRALFLWLPFVLVTRMRCLLDEMQLKREREWREQRQRERRKELREKTTHLCANCVSRDATKMLGKYHLCESCHSRTRKITQGRFPRGFANVQVFTTPIVTTKSSKLPSMDQQERRMR